MKSVRSASLLLHLIAVFQLATLHSGSAAQSLPDPAQQLRRQQEREDYQRRQAAVPPALRPAVPTLVSERLPEDEKPCFVVRRIVLEQSAVRPGRALPASGQAFRESFGWLSSALAGPDGDDPPLGKCLGVHGVHLLQNRAQDAVMVRGYITTRVLAPLQDLSGGELVLSVVPGMVQDIRLDQGSGLPVGTRTTLPLQAGDILNLRDIEQGVENLKRVPGAEVGVQIEPAPGHVVPGLSDLDLRWQQAQAARLNLSADDSGSKATGRYIGSATLSLDNPLGGADLFYLTASHDLGGGDEGARGTQGTVLHYSLPLGYWLLGATWSSSRYYQKVAGLNQDYEYSGTSENTELRLSRVVYRDASARSTASLKAWQRKISNFIDDTEVLVQRRVVGGWELSLNHRQALGGSTVEASLSWKRGTGDFDSIDAPEEAFGEGTSRLGLLQLDLSASLPWHLAGSTVTYSPALRVQDNTTPLRLM